jgi:uncharacterized membrane protein YdbT with pleckstrin-like domain
MVYIYSHTLTRPLEFTMGSFRIHLIRHMCEVVRAFVVVVGAFVVVVGAFVVVVGAFLVVVENAEVAAM